MKLTFLGTKGEIDIKNKKHKMHSCLLINYKNKKILIDFGKDWQGKLDTINPDYIFLTHAHPDHAWGLKYGTDIPIFDPKFVLEDKKIQKYPLSNKNAIQTDKWLSIAGLKIFPYEVQHSTHAPAVGYKVKTGKTTFCYNPDLIFIKKKDLILRDLDLYIGDGSTINKYLVRKIKGKLVGHTNIRTQIHWCKKYYIPKAIFTHFGRQIVKLGNKKTQIMLDEYAQSKVKIFIASDGYKIKL